MDDDDDDIPPDDIGDQLPLYAYPDLENGQNADAIRFEFRYAMAWVLHILGFPMTPEGLLEFHADHVLHTQWQNWDDALHQRLVDEGMLRSEIEDAHFYWGEWWFFNQKDNYFVNRNHMHAGELTKTINPYLVNFDHAGTYTSSNSGCM